MRSMFVWCITLFALVIAWALIVKPIVAWRRARRIKFLRSARPFVRALYGPANKPWLVDLSANADPSVEDARARSVKVLRFNSLRAHAWPLVALLLANDDGWSQSEPIRLAIAFAVVLALAGLYFWFGCGPRGLSRAETMRLELGKMKARGETAPPPPPAPPAVPRPEPYRLHVPQSNRPSPGHFRIIVQSSTEEFARMVEVRDGSSMALADLFHECAACLADHEAPEPGEPFAVELRDHGRVVDRVEVDGTVRESKP